LGSDYFLNDKNLKMKKIVFFCLAILAIGCNDSAIEKPSNLIEKDKMVDILYDISLLETVRNQGIKSRITQNDINQFILKKYKIDSLQLISSNKYYASDADKYKKLMEKVKEKLDLDDEKINGKKLEDKQSTENSETPTVY
jgi:hypothetical protein